MVRDFTEATLKEITDCCKIAQGEMEDIQIDFTDTNGPLMALYEYMGGEDILGTERENLLYHYNDLIYKSYYTAEVVEERFEKVWDLDMRYGSAFADQKAEVLDNYMASIEALADCIRVGAPGSAPMTVAQLERAKEHYRLYGSTHMDYGSIFSGNIQYRLEAVGDGFLTPILNELYNDGEINWDRVDQLMEEGATRWEIAALSRILDTYLLDSDSYEIALNNYAEFLDHCYIRQSWEYIDDYERYEDGGLSVHGYDGYILSDTVYDLLLYRQDVTDATLVSYNLGRVNKSVYNQPDDDKVQFDCFISDSLEMLYIYNDYIEVQRGYHGHLYSITGNYNGEKLESITMEVAYMKDYLGENSREVKPITVYMYNHSFITNFDFSLSGVLADGKLDADEEVVIAGLSIMKKQVTSAATGVAGDAVVHMGVNKQIYKGGKAAGDFGVDLFGLSQVREEVLANNSRIDDQIAVINYKRILTDLAAGGTVCQYGDQIVLNNRMVDERELLMRINYYNAETGSNLTLEQLEQELVNYEMSDGDTENLDKFCAFAENEGILASGACDEYESYKSDVRQELEGKGTDFEVATREQLEEACRIAAGN